MALHLFALHFFASRMDQGGVKPGGRQKTTTEQTPLTTAQQLGSLVKSARDIMRKDKGLNGDLDRLQMLAWVMFLKFFDDIQAKVDQLKTLQAQTAAELDALLPSILDRAFRGEL